MKSYMLFAQFHTNYLNFPLNHQISSKCHQISYKFHQISYMELKRVDSRCPSVIRHIQANRAVESFRKGGAELGPVRVSRNASAHLHHKHDREESRVLKEKIRVKVGEKTNQFLFTKLHTLRIS